MPLYIDIHEIPGITSQEAAAGHVMDIEIQGPFNVNYSKYWFNEQTGKIFCLCEAPNVEAAMAVHREAHGGVVAERIIEVTPELAEMFLGPADTDVAGAVVLPSRRGELDPGVRTILFTDIVDSTTMTQRFGDEAAMRVVLEHDRIVRAALNEFAGREIKHTGDGIMAVFLSAVAALRAAAQMQREIAAYARAHPDAPPLQVRIGAAAGEPVEHHADLFGATVQLAARLCGRAEPAEILVANVVADLCIGKGVPFHDGTNVELKGFEGTVHVRAVNWSAMEPLRATAP
jgi:class 3 adenylate cyclase